MHLPEKILSFFPGLRSLSVTNSTPAVEPPTSAKDGLSLHDQIQSQVQADASTAPSKSTRESTLDVSTNPTFYAAGAPDDGRLVTVVHSMAMSSGVLQEIDAEYASVSGGDVSEFLNAEFDTADCAWSMTALGSFTTGFATSCRFKP